LPFPEKPFPLSKKGKFMFDQFVFRYASQKNKAKTIAEAGTLMGVRERNGRKIFLIMVKTFFIEAFYVNDDADGELESFNVIGNISLFNSYMEKAFKAAY
jgi:hypothetical protein